ncbi:MAG: tRNA uridine-5-carboxymethylaminomethyl(34) synthesis GTPase MnmE [Clostridia bacterium]|nr:tRNA uridine-5-carboxymethylaminomethyl(34) synthesis GTPase MnmE [Clostridia bacterium]
MKTIVAISTPIGAGGIGIVRISGKDVRKIADAVFFKKGQGVGQILLENPLKMIFGTFNGIDFNDKGYTVFFPENKSFTGEDTVEFYLHGGVRIMKGAVEVILSHGAVPAEAGEFTKRAYLNGRMSLSDAEGVADMIHAESTAGIRAAYRMMQGGVADKVNGIMDDLLTVLATLEASLDYPDEMEDEVMPALDNVLPSILERVEILAKSFYMGRIAKYGVDVVIAGEPNVGKSSLLNALVGENRAIVTDIAGTTRDTVTARAEVGGVLINLTDTAGLRESDDVVEAIGVEKARKAIEGADVVLYVLDGTKDLKPDQITTTGKVYYVYNKCDKQGFSAPEGENIFIVSAVSGQGIGDLASAIASVYEEGTIDGDLITSQRHVSALKSAILAIQSAVSNKTDTIDCVLIDLREAYNHLGEITGATATEDIVDNIFSKFCVGK